jgi:hypothetical protein
MQYADTSEKSAHYRQQIAELRGKMRELQRLVEPEEVGDYEFRGQGAPCRALR